MQRSLLSFVSILGTLAFIGAGCDARPAPVAVPPVSPVEVPASAPISITEPASNAVVGNPIIASGKGIAFENTIQLRVRDADGFILGESVATAYAPEYDAPGPWQAAIVWRYVPESVIQGPPTEGYLEAYESSAKDGSEMHLVRQHIRFEMNPRIVRVFYGSGFAPDGADGLPILKPFVRNIPRTPAVARETMIALLAGPTDAEAARGVTTVCWPPDTQFRSVTIRDAAATLDFANGMIGEVPDDCPKRLLHQLRTTLTQFPTIHDVRVTIAGKPSSLFP
jgi:hypothetical protein